MLVSERFRAVLQGERLENPLVLPIVLGLAAKLTNTPLHDYLRNAEILARCQLAAAREFGYDAVFVYADNAVDAETLGAQVQWPTNAYPRILKPLLTEPEYLADYDPLECCRKGRRAEIIRACALIKDASAGEKLVVGTVVGPMSLAGQLLGMERLLFLAIDEPERLDKMLAQTKHFVDYYAKALIKAGADIIMLYEPAASPALINKMIFSRHLASIFHELIAQWSGLGVAVWLHIIGPIKRFLAQLPSLGADLFTIDDSVTWREARQSLPEACLVGNLPAPSLAILKPAVFELTAQSSRRNIDQKIIMGSDCELPLDTKPQNLQSLIKCGRDQEV